MRKVTYQTLCAAALALMLLSGCHTTQESCSPGVCTESSAPVWPAAEDIYPDSQAPACPGPMQPESFPLEYEYPMTGGYPAHAVPSPPPGILLESDMAPPAPGVIPETAPGRPAP